MSKPWNQTDVSTIYLADGRVVQAEVNGKSIDGTSGFVLVEGREIKVAPEPDQAGGWREITEDQSIGLDELAEWRILTQFDPERDTH